MLGQVRGRALSVSAAKAADIRVLRAEQTVDGIAAEFATPVGNVGLRSLKQLISPAT